MPDIKSLVENCYAPNPKYAEARAGLPENHTGIKTLGGLLEINYKLLSSREQIRRNLIALRLRGEPYYPGIIGFDDDVIPALDRALLSGHDTFLIGQIGQAKTRLVQTVAENLLSPIPVIKGSITNDCPMDLPKDDLISVLTGGEPVHDSPVFHVSPESLDTLQENKLDTPVVWLDGARRYRYVLATPDISVKDLVGHIDAIKMAKKGVETYRIDSYSPGQLMQAKHGIFCIDELPVLDPRKQVSLLSVLQEGRFTTGPYPVIFEPRTMFFATANPVDYTHSGKVIEPLFDRLGSHIHTHYPNSINDEMMIILQEARIPRSAITDTILRILATLVKRMRESEQINQERGVSVRLGIHGLEVLVGESERTRALARNMRPLPRPSDLHALSQIAKFELADLDDTIQNRNKLLHDLITQSVKAESLRLLEGTEEGELQSIRGEFGNNTFQVSQQMVWKDGQASYGGQIARFPRLAALVESRLDAVSDAQDALRQRAASLGMDTQVIGLSENDRDELRSTVLEMALEGLRWTDPKILDRRDGGYVSA